MQIQQILMHFIVNLMSAANQDVVVVLVVLVVVTAVQVKNIKRLANPVERIVGTRANIECRRPLRIS